MNLGTRGSPLALSQSEWVCSRLVEAHPGLQIKLVVIRTTGDGQQGEAEGTFFGSGGQSLKGIFVKEIEDALLDGSIDCAVHSLKDLPTEQPADLVISAIPVREDPRDALATRHGGRLEDLPEGACVGTSSPRRAAQLLAARRDLRIEPVRGNIETRLRKMESGALDAVVLAAAGLARLGLSDPDGRTRDGGARVCILPIDVCTPAAGQGALALETRTGSRTTRRLLEAIHDEASAAQVEAERAFLEALGGGCRVPVAALARPTTSGLEMRGVVLSADGAARVVVEGACARGAGIEMGIGLAREALRAGAASILEGAPRW